MRDKNPCQAPTPGVRSSGVFWLTFFDLIHSIRIRTQHIRTQHRGGWKMERRAGTLESPFEPTPELLKEIGWRQHHEEADYIPLTGWPTIVLSMTAQKIGGECRGNKWYPPAGSKMVRMPPHPGSCRPGTPTRDAYTLTCPNGARWLLVERLGWITETIYLEAFPNPLPKPQ